MSAPVDVLAVMDTARGSVAYLAEIRKQEGLNVAAGIYSLESKEIAQARAAVAELLEADRYYDDAQFGLARARYNSEPLETWTKACTEADIRRAAALARGKGESK